MALLKPETALRYRLVNDADISAIISARIYPHMPKQGASFPYMVYERNSSQYHHKMGATTSTNLVQHSITFMGFGTAEQYSSLATLGIEIRASIDGFRGSIAIGGDSINFEMCHCTGEREGVLDPADGAGNPLHFIEQQYEVAYQTA